MDERTTARRRPAGERSPASAPKTPNRRRRTRKPPVKALAICAGIIFLAGFLLGYLVRGWFLPKPEQEQTPQLPQESQGSQLPAETGGAGQAATQTDPPQLSVPDWRLVLVNAENPLPESYAPELTKLSGGMAVDKRCYSDLQSLLSACKAADFAPTIVKAYVSREEQQVLCDADPTAPKPGQSEHQTGLAVDIVNANNQNLDERQRGSEIGLWLVENAWKYGFIQRYPESAAAETGVAFEPWHYRYVGTEAAKAIHDQGLTLEGYLKSTGG